MIWARGCLGCSGGYGSGNYPVRSQGVILTKKFNLDKGLPSQKSGSYSDSQTPDFGQNDTQLYFV